MNSIWISIEDISPWENNPRINDHAVQQIAVSIKQYGFINPIIVQKNSNRIIAGHTRYKAAKMLGLATLPVIFTDFDDVKAKAYAIADNKLSELSQWDERLLEDVLIELQEKDINLESLGFSEFELDSIFSNKELEIEYPENDDEIIDNQMTKIVVSISAKEYDDCLKKLHDAIKHFSSAVIK